MRLPRDLRRLKWGSDLVLCITRVESILDMPISEANWQIVPWCEAADVFMQNVGGQTLKGQACLGGSALRCGGLAWTFQAPPVT